MEFQMNKLIAQTVLGLVIAELVISSPASGMISMMKSGIYAGVGGSGSTIDESFNSKLSIPTASAYDSYSASRTRLTPLVQVGYWMPLSRGWLWGAVSQWKYLGYNTPNVNTSRGQYLPNASFSSQNFFGSMVNRDFSSLTRVNNEFLLLLYGGMQVNRGFAYLGLGPSAFTGCNRIYNSSVHIPNGTGNTLISTSVTSCKTLWGGAIQAGYNYYFDPTWFLNFNYTYVQSGWFTFKNSINTALYNGANTPSGPTLTLNRQVRLSTQEIMVSINKVF